VGIFTRRLRSKGGSLLLIPRGSAGRIDIGTLRKFAAHEFFQSDCFTLWTHTEDVKEKGTKYMVYRTPLANSYRIAVYSEAWDTPYVSVSVTPVKRRQAVPREDDELICRSLKDLARKIRIEYPGLTGLLQTHDYNGDLTLT
jgi:hypothetical protein